MDFDMSRPFKPFEQLLAVLPAASKELLPPALQGLMVNETSPIIDYYPPEFECDLNGKQQEWEAVVLIPFIDEKRLLEAMKEPLKHMTQEEAGRNVHGPMQVYDFTAQDLGPYFAPSYFPEITKNHAKLTKVDREEWVVPLNKLKHGLMAGVKLDVFFPGFPTLHHIPHRARLATAGVRVFEQASRGENMILKLSPQGEPATADVARELLGKEIWVAWPHMIEAKVLEVADANNTYHSSQGGLVCEPNDERQGSQFEQMVKSITERYKTRWGVEIGPTRVILQAAPMTGRKYVCGHKGRITLEKQWSKSRQPFALHTTR